MILPETLTPQHQRIVALADNLAARFAATAAEYDRSSTFPLQHYTDLHTAGYLRLVIPREYGGEEVSLFEMILAQERLGRGDGATAMTTGMLIQLLGRLREERPWDEAIFATVCRSIAKEGGLINSVITEPELGSISRGGVPATTATPVAGGWHINGHKIFVTGAPALRYLVVGVALPPSEDAPQGTVANAIVHAGTPGLRIETTWSDTLSLRACGSDDVFLSDVFVPDDWVVDRRPIGVQVANSKRPGVNGWSLNIAAAYLGVGQAACDAACDYANNRVPPSLGTPIAELAHIQQLIGEMQIQLNAARAVLHETARLWDTFPELRPQLAAQVASAKYLCTNAACNVSDKALRVAGGFSITRALPLERYFRDARAGLFQPPQDDLALMQMGRAALGGRK